ncbi:MAG: hypothetical protein H0V70_15115 [Ktedonobacteraceae bacterium]|nr:hypothetical protein [Ktedonobacteraceae bacterium]
MQIKNISSFKLNFIIFNLAPDWSITKIFPYDEPYHILAPGDEYILDLQASLSDRLTHGTDRLKVFATLDETDFGCLELPALDRQRGYRGGTINYHPTTPLEELLFALMEDTPRTCNFDLPGVRSAWEWVTAQLAVDVRQA